MWCDGLSLEEWENNHEDDGNIEYLHGICHEWVIENAMRHDKYVLITETRENKICIMHCCILRNGKYVDVRGETSSFNDIIDAFDYGEFDVLVFDTIYDFVNNIENIIGEIPMWNT